MWNRGLTFKAQIVYFSYVKAIQGYIFDWITKLLSKVWMEFLKHHEKHCAFIVKFSRNFSCIVWLNVLLLHKLMMLEQFRVALFSFQHFHITRRRGRTRHWGQSWARRQRADRAGESFWIFTTQAFLGSTGTLPKREFDRLDWFGPAALIYTWLRQSMEKWTCHPLPPLSPSPLSPSHPWSGDATLRGTPRHRPKRPCRGSGVSLPTHPGAGAPLMCHSHVEWLGIGRFVTE